MAIINAIQKGQSVHVYGENNRQLFVKAAGNGTHDGLQGYTSSSVSIRMGNSIHTYNEKGRQISVRAL